MQLLIGLLALLTCVPDVALASDTSGTSGWGVPKSGAAMLTGFVRVDDVFTGESLVGATVTLVDTGAVVTTDANGRYQFYSLPHDTYTVEASYPGYAPSTCTRVIDADDTFWCSVAVSEAPPPDPDPDPDPIDTGDPPDPDPDPDPDPIDTGEPPDPDPDPDPDPIDTGDPPDPGPDPDPTDTGYPDDPGADDTGDPPGAEDDGADESRGRREPTIDESDHVRMGGCSTAPAAAGWWLPLLLLWGRRARGGSPG